MIWAGWFWLSMRNCGLFLQPVDTSVSCNVPCWATCLWSHPPTLGVVVFFYVELFLQTKLKTLARALGVVSAMCFSLVLILWGFFNIYIPSSFPWFLSSFLFLSKWCRTVEQVIVLQESVVVRYREDVSVVLRKSKIPGAFSITNMRVSKGST